jgi:hypothetical protein
LEDRWVPTTITPTTFADGVLGSGSLRDAVLQFNADTGTQDDIIQLLAGTYTLTIQNTGRRHETAGLTGDLNLTQTSHRWIIQGAGPSTVIDASQLQDRVFQIVNPGTQVLFQNLVIQGGLAQDDGSNGASAGISDALGGGILNNGGNVTLNHVVVQNNVAQGGLGLPGHLQGHIAGGGGIYSSGGVLSVVGTTIANNQAIGGLGHDYFLSYMDVGGGGTAAGGGLYASGGSLDISDSTIVSNHGIGGRGGDGYVFYSTATIITYPGGPGGSSQGGGLYVSGGSLTIAASTISSNQATGGDPGAYGYYLNGAGEGGGLYNSGTLTVSSCTLAGNSASAPDISSGGGIFNNGTLTVTGSTLSGNSAYSYGGGISNGGTLTVSNSTLSGNSSGGIYNYGTLNIWNTILAGNLGGDLYGTVTSGSHNLIGGAPLLGPLRDNGGPTWTMALLPGSPALNAGDPAQLGTADQRGVVRAGGVNIGAYQASASAFVLTAPDTATAGTPFDVTVTAVDPFGQTAVGYTGTVTFSSADPYRATLPADYPFRAADHGVHTFPGGATLYTAGTWDVTATDTATGSITGSTSVAVNPAAADHLLFLQMPTDTAAGQTISPGVMVAVVDQFGNIVTSDNSDTITLTIGNNPSGGTLSGTLTVTVVNGIATFNDLVIDLAGDGYTLHATTAGLTDADSSAFRITA